MVEAKLLYKILGSLLIMLGLLMGGCALMAGCYQEDDIMHFSSRLSSLDVAASYSNTWDVTQPTT